MGEAVNHADRAHAVLSASSASQWLNCTPSARLSEKLEEQRSEYADEGTLAHEYSENEIRYKLGLIDEKEYNGVLRKCKAHKMYTTDLAEQCEPYILLVFEQIAEAQFKNPDALILVETKVSLEEFIEEGFGTCDVIVIADGIMWITDLKFGKGVRVSAIDNSQLKLYGAGALTAFDMLYDIQTVRLTISQPRLDSISSWDIDAQELLDWAYSHVKTQAALAFFGEGEHIIGDWCRFCKGKVLCPALREEALRFAQSDFSEELETLEIEDEYLLNVYDVADRIKSYLSAVEDHIFKQALAGKKWPGYKLVEGRSVRTIKDEIAALKALRANSIDEDFIVNRKLKGLGDLTKYLGAKKFDDILGKFISKPPGKPTLVIEDDKREAINKADDFAD